MEINISNTKVEIRRGNSGQIYKSYPVNSLVYEKTEDGISLLSLDNIYLHSAPIREITVDGVQMTADNADSLLSALFV